MSNPFSKNELSYTYYKSENSKKKTRRKNNRKQRNEREISDKFQIWDIQLNKF
jgi:hypothetical protein